MPQAVVTKNVGLVTQYNSMTVVDGALVQADNAVVRRENIVENRRGYESYGSLGAEPYRFFTYSNRVLSHLQNDTIVYDNGSGTFAAYSGTYTSPDGYLMKGLEANNNLYVTTSAGVKVIGDVSGTAARSAGVPQPMMVLLEAFVSGVVGDDWLPNGDSVAYRVCFTYRDSNNNFYRSAPSAITTLENTSGSAAGVLVTALLPDSITTDYSMEVYRSATVTGTPNDEMVLVNTVVITDDDITNGTGFFYDVTPYSLVENGTPLYTNESQEGIAQSNNEPPACVDTCLYKSNYMFYANTYSKQSLNLTLVNPDKILIAIEATTVSGSPTVTVSSDDFKPPNGSVLWGGTGFTPGTPTVSSSTDTTITLSTNASASGTTTLIFVTSTTLTIGSQTFSFKGSATFGLNQIGVDYTLTATSAIIEQIANSIVYNVNTSSTNTQTYAYYVSGSSDLPGRIAIVARSYATPEFEVTTSADISGTFFPEVGTTATASTTSSNDANTNYVYYSKYQELEAVPALNFLQVGPKNSTIHRVFALRDSVIVVTDKGVYRISGETAPFSVAAIDLTVFSIAPESWATLANVVLGLSNQGVVAISDTSVSVVSRDIEPNVLPLLGFDYTGTVGLGVGAGYESDRSYLLSVPTLSTDTTPNQTYVYNAFTKAWTRWTHALSGAVVLPSDDKLYFGIPTIHKVYKERKDFTSSDYFDAQYDITITSVSGDQVTYTAAVAPKEGDVITDGPSGEYELIILSVDVASSPYTVTVNQTVPSGVEGAAVIKPGIPMDIEWNSWTAGAPGMLKRVYQVSVLADTIEQSSAASRLYITFRTDVDFNEQERQVDAEIALWGDAPWGSLWGGSPGTQRYTTYVPKTMVYSRTLSVGVKHQVGGERMSIGGVAYDHEVVAERSTR